MKRIFFLLCCVSLLGAGCTQSTNLEQTSDFTPVNAPATRPNGVEGGAYERQLKSAISYDGLSFIQQNQTIGGQMNVPDVIQKDGILYLYFTGQTLGERANETAVAISENNGETWIYKYLEFSTTSDVSLKVADPDVILLEDGTIRMYFTGSHTQSAPGIHFAESQDGIHFTYQSPIFLPSDSKALDSTTFKIGDTWHMFVMKDQDLAQQFHLTSKDGINFEQYSITSFVYEGTPHMPANGYWLNDKYHLFMFNPADGIIRSMWTKDGISWYPNPGTTLEPDKFEGEAYVKDPAVIQMEDTYLMFYVTNL